MRGAKPATYESILRHLRRGRPVLVFVKSPHHWEYDRYRLITPNSCEFDTNQDWSTWGDSCFTTSYSANRDEGLEPWMIVNRMRLYDKRRKLKIKYMVAF